MTISVALGTYNGARFLQGQLDSLAAQQRLPDELVVGDDSSTDATAEIVTRFAEAAPFSVRLMVNPGNMGSTGNFGQTLAHCRGDIIALCDQDDVWLPQKLRRMEAAFAASPRTGLVFTDAELVTETLEPLHTRLWPVISFPPSAQRRVNRGQAVEVLLRANVVTGATMAFRADLRDVILPLPESRVLLHDGWIALIAAALSPVACLPEPLILYRQHPGQQLGRRAVVDAANATVAQTLAARPKDYYREHLRLLRALSDRLSHTRHVPDAPRPLPDVLRRIAAQRRHIQCRLDLPAGHVRRLAPILTELFLLRYHRYSNGFRSLGRDLLG